MPVDAASFTSHTPASGTGVSAATDVVTAALTRQAERTGLLVAAAVAPSTLTRSLGPRSAVDQGIISGLVMGLTYATTVATQDALTALASVGAHGGPDQVRRRLALVDLAAIPIGLAVSRAVTVRDDESPLRSLVRQAAWRSGATGLGSLVFLGTDWAARRLDARVGSQARLQRLPLALPGGLLLAGYLEWQRRRDLPPEAASDPEEVRAALPASLGI